MATTSIWKIDSRLDIVVDYVVNEKKTNEDSYYNLHKVIEYAKASYKTEQQLYVTALAVILYSFIGLKFLSFVNSTFCILNSTLF